MKKSFLIALLFSMLSLPVHAMTDLPEIEVTVGNTDQEQAENLFRQAAKQAGASEADGPAKRAFIKELEKLRSENSEEYNKYTGITTKRSGFGESESSEVASAIRDLSKILVKQIELQLKEKEKEAASQKKQKWFSIAVGILLLLIEAGTAAGWFGTAEAASSGSG